MKTDKEWQEEAKVKTLKSIDTNLSVFVWVFIAYALFMVANTIFG
ncbi:MAG: hypothetical protein ACI9T7_000177 [Oleiphilaceae bacterium]